VFIRWRYRGIVTRTATKHVVRGIGAIYAGHATALSVDDVSRYVFP